MSRGLVSPQLPYTRKEAVELLKADYPDRDTAKRKITDGVTGNYRANYPEIYNPKRALVEQSAENVAAICCAFDISSLDSVGPGVLRNQMSGALATRRVRIANLWAPRPWTFRSRKQKGPRGCTISRATWTRRS